MSATDDQIEAALKRFEKERPRLTRAGDAIVARLRELLAAEGVAARLSPRVKEVDSYRVKVLTKNYDDPWADVTDKVGVRALVDRAGDVDEVHRVIQESEIRIWDTTDKRTELELKELGYSGLHLDLYAPAEPGDTEQIPVELQIRTVAQDAWSVVSHKLIYKPQVELLESDKRAIMRLVALVEIFDEEVERVMAGQPIPTTAADAGAPDLVSMVVAQYARFEQNEGHRALTAAVMEIVQTTLADDEKAGYQQTLAMFVDDNREAIAQLYADYGVRSGMTTSPDYVLWSQPESVALLESLENRPNRLLNVWRDAGLPDAWLRPLAAHTTAELEI